MSNILITSVGKRVSLLNAFKHELKALFPRNKVFVADAIPSLSAACAISDNSFLVPRLDNPSYIDKLINKCIQNDIRLVIPTIDTELLLLAENEEKLLRNNIVPVISSVSFIEKCRDKRKIHTFFNSMEIDVAKEYPKSNYTLPLYIKPIDGSRSANNFIITEESQILETYVQNDNFMFLEYLDHYQFQEYTCDLYYGKDDKLKCVVPRKRIEVRDGEVNKGKTEKNILVDYIIKKLGVIKGARGCLTSQFFLHKESNKIIGIEINPRFGGGFPLSYHAGANYPKWIIEEYLQNKSINEFHEWEDNLLMLRYDDGIYIKGSNA